MVSTLLGFKGEVMHLIRLVSVWGQKAGQEGSKKMREGRRGVGEQMSAMPLSQQEPLNEKTFCSIFGILGLT